MKILDISNFDVVKTGIEFHLQTSTDKDYPAVAELLPNMERNEDAVFWLQPRNGTVEQQEACICVNGKFYALNSKFEKAIFRNVTDERAHLDIAQAAENLLREDFESTDDDDDA